MHRFKFQVLTITIMMINKTCNNSLVDRQNWKMRKIKIMINNEA